MLLLSSFSVLLVNAGCKNALISVSVLTVNAISPFSSTIASSFTKMILSAVGVAGFVIGIVNFATKLLPVPAPFAIVPTTSTLFGTVTCVLLLISTFAVNLLLAIL